VLVLQNSGKKLAIGDAGASAFDVFPKPSNDRVLAVHDLPATLTGQNYVANGWDDETEGFGVILQQNRVVAALYTVKSLANDLSQVLIQNYESLNPGLKLTHLTAKNLDYYFWEMNGQRLMLLVQKNDKQSNRITLILGIDSILNALRANPELANADIKNLETLKNNSGS